MCLIKYAGSIINEQYAQWFSIQWITTYATQTELLVCICSVVCDVYIGQARRYMYAKYAAAYTLSQ